MPEETINPPTPSLDELAEQKQQAFNKVGSAVAAYKAALREVAGVESKISAYLIGMGRPQEAVLNLVSEASLLVRADEFAEAASVYRKALDHAYTEQLQGDINAAIVRLEKTVEDLKANRPVQPIVDLVAKFNGEVINAQEGLPGTERFVEFRVNSLRFRVDCTTLYKVTNEFDTEGYEVTTVERVEERVKDALAKIGIADRAEAEQDEADYDDFDDDEE